MLQEAKTLIEKAWIDRRLLKNDNTGEAIRKIIELLNSGDIRVAEPACTGEWLVNEWIKKGVILYFSIQEINLIELSPFEYHDKIPLKTGYNKIGTRIVPPTVARFGSYIDKDVVLMPSYVNIGAHIESGTLVDIWASIGSCAQICKNVHISTGVTIGGVLEPPQAEPVIVENGCFIGSNCVIKEGVFVEKEVILSAGLTITQSSNIIDVTKKEPVEYKGRIPKSAIVVKGNIIETFTAGDYYVPCALIIGYRKESEDLKATLKTAIRDYNLAV